MVKDISTVTANSLREQAQPVIAEATRRLVAEFQPEQVWLFGSYAWGEPNEDSDLDFAVVVKDGDETAIHRSRRAHGCLGGIGFAKDVLVQAGSSFRRYRNARPSLTYKIVREGRLLHGLETFEAGGVSRSQDVLVVNAELAREWLRKAEQSLKTAELLASEADRMLEIAVYHCQQASEKTLKGYLTMQDEPALKTHDLKLLASGCARFDLSFHEFEADASWLNPLAAGYRYPGDTNCIEPSRADLDTALAAARRIYDFVLSVLPPETHPV